VSRGTGLLYVRQKILPHVQQPRATWTAQCLAADAGQHIAADLRDVDWQLSDALRGIDEVRNAVTARNLSNGRGRVDEAAVGRHPCQRDQAHPLVEHRLQRLRIDSATGVGRNRFDRCACPLCCQAHGREIAAPFVARNENALARVPCTQRGECGTPGRRVARGYRDLRRLRVEQSSGERASMFRSLTRCHARFHGARGCFEP
jgi:hypothetical protein